MANIIEMPKLSDTMTVGTLVKWLKQEGDAVKNGDMLAEVETDKATMELESFFDGTLLRIFSPAGSQVDIGAPLCAIGKPGETVEVPASTPVAKSTEKKTEEQPAAEGKPTGNAVQEAAEPPSQKDNEDGAESPTPKDEAQAQPEAAGKTKAAGAPTGSSPSPSRVSPPPRPATTPDRLKISPLARKLAVEKNVDPARVTGSGPGGRIVRADILAAPAAPQSQISNLKSQMANTPGVFARGPIQEEKTVQVSNMRAAIARRLLESKTQLPHFYVEIEIDAGPLLALREQLNTGLESEGVKLSVNDFILKSSAEALRRVPAVNGAWEPAGSGPAHSAGSGQAQIRYFGAAHVAFAVAIDDGLITPVIRDAHLKSIFQISSEAKSLGKLARDKKLKPEQFTGGTFCVSNLGMMGIPRFSAIINPPNAAILAVGATVKKPVVKNDQIVIGQAMTLTLSCDHRVVDGALGAQYLNALKQLLESPALLLV